MFTFAQRSNSFVLVKIGKTSWGGSKKFEDIDFENTQTFSVPNDRIQLVLFNDCRQEEIIFEKVMFNFNLGNTINISRSIRRCKKTSIFENFLVVESFVLLIVKLQTDCSEQRLCTKMTPPRTFSWKFSAWAVQKQLLMMIIGPSAVKLSHNALEQPKMAS